MLTGNVNKIYSHFNVPIKIKFNSIIAKNLLFLNGTKTCIKMKYFAIVYKYIEWNNYRPMLQNIVNL